LRYENPVERIRNALLWLTLFAPFFASAQIDPVKRDLVQFGYNQAFEGHQPLAAYAFYYHNQPDFLSTNLTLRLALAPVYLDSELGFTGAFGPNTDWESVWRAAVLVTATTKSTTVNIYRVNHSMATAGKFRRAFTTCLIPATKFR
jgi:hypothetical protein